jgi:hypothetical protein
MPTSAAGRVGVRLAAALAARGITAPLARTTGIASAQPSQPPRTAHVTGAHERGFGWADAAIGAFAMAGVLGVTGACSTSGRFSHEAGAAPLGTD